ncbi:hypothetical protein V8C35DRAFT_277120 [Trichoderma chlorosporum]
MKTLFAKFKRHKGRISSEDASKAKSPPTKPSSHIVSTDHSFKDSAETDETQSVQTLNVPLKSSKDPTTIQSENSSDVSQEIWTHAYENLRFDSETAELVEAYEKILSNVNSENNVTRLSSESPNVLGPLEGSGRMARMGEITRTALAKARQNNDANMNVQEVVNFLKTTQNVIGTMLAAYPPASMAWSGICAILPVIASPSIQTLAMADGLFYVMDRMEWYLAISGFSLKVATESSDDLLRLQGLFKAKVIELIQALLEFEIKSVCSCFATNPLLRALKAMLFIDDWKARVDALKALEDEIKAYLSQYSDISNSVTLAKISQDTAHLSVIMKELKLLRVAETQNSQWKIDSRRLELIAKFSTETTCPYTERMMAVPKRVENTCKWFQSHTKYRAWLDSPDGGLLLLSADPGCGKSVLSRFLAEEILPREMPETILCYFFFKDSPDQNNLPAALCAIIHQVLSRQPELTDIVSKDIIENGATLTTKERVLWRIFEKITARTNGRSVVCILDALDECHRVDRITLVEQIQRFIERNQNAARGTLQNDPKMRFLVTTRGYPDILQLFHPFMGGCIWLAGENKEESDEIQAEISLVIAFRLDRLSASKGLNNKRKKIIWDSLMLKGGQQRTYLWVQLVFEVLEANLRDQLVIWKKLINTVPQTVYDAYDKLLDKVRDTDKERVKMLLSLMIVAVRPIPLRTAILLIGAREYADNKDTEYDDGPDWESDEGFKAWVIGACGSFVTIYDEQLFFIHQTAKEFLQSNGTTVSSDASTTFKFSISEKDAHRTMAENCIAVWKYGGLETDDERYLYCVELWAEHFRDAQIFSTVHGKTVVRDIDDRFWNIYLEMLDDARVFMPASMEARSHNHAGLGSENAKLEFLATYGHYRLLDCELRKAVKAMAVTQSMIDMPCVLYSTGPYEHCSKLLLEYFPSRPVIILENDDE